MGINNRQDKLYDKKGIIGGLDNSILGGEIYGSSSENYRDITMAYLESGTGESIPAVRNYDGEGSEIIIKRNNPLSKSYFLKAKEEVEKIVKYNESKMEESGSADKELEDKIKSKKRISIKEKQIKQINRIKYLKRIYEKKKKYIEQNKKYLEKKEKILILSYYLKKLYEEIKELEEGIIYKDLLKKI